MAQGTSLEKISQTSNGAPDSFVATRRGSRTATETVKPEWFSLRELTEYASISERTLREWLHFSTDALPGVRVDGKILVRKSQFDEWLERHRIQPGAAIDVDAIVTSLFKEAE